MARRDRAARMNADTERIRRDRQAKQGQKAAKREREKNGANLRDVQQRTQQLEEDREALELVEASEANWEERNDEYRNLGANAIARHLLWILALSFAIFIDIFLLGAVGPQLAKTAETTFGARAWVAPVGTILLSIAFVGIELCSGFGLKGKRRSFKGTAIAVLVCLAMPLTVIGFSLINSGLLSTDPTKIIGPATRNALIFTTITGGVIALAAHGFVLIFGGRMMKGLGYGIYKIGQVPLRRRRDRLETSVGKGTGDVESSFRNFYDAYRNRENGGGATGEPTVVPFGARTRRVVNEVYEDEVIEDPPVQRRTKPNPGREPPAEPEPEPAPNAGPESADQQQGTRDDNSSETDTDDPGVGYDTDGEDEVRR